MLLKRNKLTDGYFISFFSFLWAPIEVVLDEQWNDQNGRDLKEETMGQMLHKQTNTFNNIKVTAIH